MGKHVLSANQEIPIHMDSLYDDMGQFEELCEDLAERATAPITNALASANVTLDQVDVIELIGGGMRVPKVQSSLKSFVGDKELGMHINSDESMALGASFYGANISSAFRVRQVGLVDINPFPIEISLDGLEAVDDEKFAEAEEAWGKKATIFKANSKIGVKKTIAFTHDQDVHCSLDYADSDVLPEGAKKELQRYRISGVAAFAKEMEEKGLGKPKVSLQFELSSSGTTSLVKAEAVVEETYTVEVEVEVVDDEETETSPGANDTLDHKNSSDDTTSESESKAEENVESQNDTSKEESSTDEKGEPKKKKTKMIEKEKKKSNRKSLDVESYHVGKIRPLSKDLIDEYKANIAALAELDRQRVLLEESKNKLESYFYYVKNKLIDEEEQIAKISTQEQREELAKLSRDAEDWLFDEGDTADQNTIQAKYDELATPAENVWFRLKEMTARPDAVKALTEKLVEIEEKFSQWVADLTHITDEEKDDVFSKIESARKWLSDKVDAQAEKDGHEDPVFQSEEVPLQTKPIQKLIAKLSKKPKPKPPKVEKEAENNSTEQGQTDKGDKESASAGASETDEKEKDDSDVKDDKTEEKVETDGEL